MTDAETLSERLIAAGWDDLARLPQRVLPMRGVAHDHVALEGSGLLLRLPRLSQWSQDADAALVYQAACFERAAPSGHTPALKGILPPAPGLPRGALLVAEVAGVIPCLPGDLGAIARALAAVHALALPAQRAPLVDQSLMGGPFAATLAGITAHAAFLPRAGLHPQSAALLSAELTTLQGLAATPTQAEPLRLVGTDTHPGNFLVAADGRAVFVDLEKAMYGAPAIDLAHATLPTSTLWDPAIALELDAPDTAAFYRAWAEASAPSLVDASRPWFQPTRRLTWLRTLFWAVRWRVLTAEDADWSHDRVDPALADYRAATVDRLLAPTMLQRMREDLLDLTF